MRLSRVMVAAALGLAAEARAADPAPATYSHDRSRLFWLVHASDTHIGADFYDEDGRLAWLLGEGLDAIAPALVVVTGDLVDASPYAVPTTGQDPDEWSRYHQLTEDAGMTPDYYFDLPGNHDAYGDGPHAYYLAHSVSGPDHGTTRAIVLPFPWGEYLVYGTATTGEDGATILEHPQLSTAELDEMAAVLAAEDDTRLRLVFGHHGLGTPDGGEQARDLLSAAGAHYFHGHVHTYKTYLDGGIVVREVNSLGKATTRNVAVVAIDNDAIAYAVVDSEDPWPFVVITAPADRRLTTGDEDPTIYDVCRGTDNPVRALVFDKGTVTGVMYSAGGGPPLPMTRATDEPRLWEARWDASGLPAGETAFVVTATGEKTKTRAITIRLADVPCPEVVPPPDEPLGLTIVGLEDPGEVTPVVPGIVLTPPEDGCGCRAGGRGGAAGALALLAIFAVVRRRRASPP